MGGKAQLVEKDNLVDLDNPVEEVRGTLTLHLLNLRILSCVSKHSIKEGCRRGEGIVYPTSKTLVEGTLSLSVEVGRKHTLGNKLLIRIQLAHIVCIGLKLAHDSLHNIYLDRIATTRQLNKGCVDRIVYLDSLGHIVGKDIELHLLEIIQIYHIAISTHIAAHLGTLLIAPSSAR